MHILLVILQCLGWALLALLALLLILLLVPVRVRVHWDEKETRVKLYVLFIGVQILPEKEKPQKKPQKAKPQKAQKKDTPAKPKKHIEWSVDKVLALLDSAKGATALALRGISLRKTELVYAVHKDDAAKTAIAYGQTQAVLASAVAVLENALHVYFTKLEIIPDFNNEHEYENYAQCVVHAFPIPLLVAAVYMFKGLLSEKII